VTDIAIRAMTVSDARVLADAFAAQGWDTPVDRYLGYVRDQAKGSRDAMVASLQGEIAGYVTIRWSSEYAPFRVEGIPEIQDLNVLQRFQRRAIATHLVDAAEERIALRSPTAGIGVGMDASYGAAQRMYTRRGYVPDGLGLTHRGRHVAWGDLVPVDDDLVLYLTRQLRD
jgi:ribosomal protein S18 acetylase RimI-like enzyme